MSNLNLQAKIILLFSSSILVLLLINTILEYQNFKKNLEEIENMKAYNLLTAVKSAMEKTQHSQADEASVMTNLRVMVKEFTKESSKERREEIALNSLYYKSSPFRTALSVGEIAGEKDGYSVMFQMVNARNLNEEAIDFSKESILKADKNREFFFEIDWSSKSIQAFLAIKVTKFHLKDYGTIEDDVDGMVMIH